MEGLYLGVVTVFTGVCRNHLRSAAMEREAFSALVYA
jgi:hypothetical protein